MNAMRGPNPYESSKEAASSPRKSLERIRRENETLATIGCVVLLAIVGALVMMEAVSSLGTLWSAANDSIPPPQAAVTE